VPGIDEPHHDVVVLIDDDADVLPETWTPARRGGRRPGRKRGFAVAALVGALACVLVGGAAILLEQPLPGEVLGSADPKVPNGTKADLPPSPPPPIEDFLIKDLAPDDAVAINAKVPFSSEPNPAAAPFIFPSNEDDYERAVDCLAAAVWYEAGDDLTGQQAVAQVVINRARHPAYTPSICGVVFQGSERATGCQFTFTCDGSMIRRKPSAGAWQRAQRIARLALAGYVSRAVGHATHYHTNWVVPYWSAKLDKITMVGTHIFFRWNGWWGTPRAFAARIPGVEAKIPKLALLSPMHGASAEAAAVTQVDGGSSLAVPDEGIATTCELGCEQRVAFAVAGGSRDSTILLARISGQSDGADFPSLASDLCGARSRCVVMAWTDARRIPPGLPASTNQLQSMDFHYLRDPALGEARSRWNCARFAPAASGRCLSHQSASGAAP